MLRWASGKRTAREQRAEAPGKAEWMEWPQGTAFQADGTVWSELDMEGVRLVYAAEESDVL